MLSTYLFLFRRHTLFVLAVTLLLASTVLALLSLRPPAYQSVAVLSVGIDNVAAEVLGQNRYQEPERRIATELETLRSRPVAEAAAELLAEQGRPASVAEVGRSVEAQARGESNYLEVVGTAQQSVRAQQLTEAVVNAYLEYRSGVGRDQLERLEIELQDRVTAAERDLAGLPAESRARAVAQERVDRAQQPLEAVRLRLSVETTDVQLVSSPSTPETAVGLLGLPVAIVVSLVTGAFLAMALLLGLELLRDRVRTPGEAAHVTGEPVLAHLGVRQRGTPRTDEQGSDAGAVRSLRLGLTTANGGTFPDRVMLVGSKGDAAAALEAARKLAAGCTAVGMRVLLLADIDGPEAVGSAAASGGATWSGHEHSRTGLAWRRVTGTPAGGAGWLDVPDPDRELSRLCTEHDAIILAAPADLSVDPLVLAPSFGAVLVAATVGRASARPLRELVGRLQERSAGLMGLVLVEGGTRSRRSTFSAQPPFEVVDTDTERRPASAGAL